MSLLNRAPEYSHLYDAEGRLQGGLSALEELAQVIAIGSGAEQDQDTMDDDDAEQIEPTQDFPVSSASHDTSSLIDSDEDMSGDEPGSSDEEAMEEIAMFDEAPPPATSPRAAGPMSIPSPPPQSPSEGSPSPGTTPPGSPGHSSLGGDVSSFPYARQSSWNSDSDTSLRRPRSSSSRRSFRKSMQLESAPGLPVLGERLKQQFLETNVLSTLFVSCVVLNAMKLNSAVSFLEGSLL